MAADFRFGSIAFEGRNFEGPYSDQAITDLLPEIVGDVLDVGCGKGAVLGQLGVRGLGIDRNPISIEYARIHVPQCDFHLGEAKALIPGLKLQPDLILNLGASQAIGTPADALAYFSTMLRPGGHLVFGDGIWDKQPTTRYLKFLGSMEHDMGNFEQFREAGHPYGFRCEQAYHSTQDDWDSFEDHYFETMVRWCDANPEDPDSAGYRQRMKAWRDMYLSEGRGTLGFAIALFRRQ